MGYEKRSLEDFSQVATNVESTLRNVNLPYAHHKAVAPLSSAEQQHWLDKAEQEQLSVRELREQIRESNKPETPSLPEGKYNVIYADPPWEYDFSETESRKSENKYPTMSVEEIKQLDIPFADNSVLFLWATAPKIREALEVMEAWGFEYKTHAIWDKEIIGMGYWFRGQDVKRIKDEEAEISL